MKRGESLTIGVLSQWFSPEPVEIPKSVVDMLVARGHRVRVITGFPSYPGGTLYAGFDNRCISLDENEDVSLLRVKSYLSHDQNAVHRFRSFIGFALASTRHCFFLRDCDVVYVYGTPMTAAAGALLLRVIKRIPFVLHLQDLWPESVIDSGMISDRRIRGLLERVLRLLLKPMYSLAHRTIVISPGMKSALVQRGVAAASIQVILNWHAGENKEATRKRSVEVVDNKLHVVYAGNLGKMQDIENVIRAARLVQDEFPLIVSIYGTGVVESELKSLAGEIGARNVEFHGRVPAAEMAKVNERCDFQLVTLRNIPVFEMTIPSKFQGAISGGVPVIVTVPGDLAKLCKDNDIGLTAEPEDPESLADALRQASRLGPAARAAMGRRAKAFYWGHLSANHAASNLLSVLMDAAGARNERDRRRP